VIVRALHGIRLLLDSASARTLEPILDSAAAPATSPAVEVSVGRVGACVPPSVLEVLSAQAASWIGRTATGLIIGDREQSWLAIDGPPPAIRGVVGPASSVGALRELLLKALLIALRTSGVYGLHAAAVCVDDRALLLVGESGAGKSTTTTALASVGCRYLGDDGVLLRDRSGDVELFALWSSFRLTDRVVSSFAALKPHLSKVARDDKWKLDSSSAFPSRHLTHWAGATSLLFLERSMRSSSSLSPISLAEATGLMIAQSSALAVECHPNPRQHLDLLAALANRGRVARLELGSEWLEDPLGAARRLIDTLRSNSSPAQLRSEAS
jgi:hypothetical protein